jgi:hypothetical protein
MTVFLRYIRAILILVICFCAFSSIAQQTVSRDQATRIATHFLRHYENMRSLRCTAWLRWGDFAEEADPAIRKRLSQRKYWFVSFTPRDPDVYGGAHRIYVAADTGEILGRNTER